MRIVEIAPLSNGAHKNQTISRLSKIPNGWAIIPDNIITENFPIGEIEVEEIDGVTIVTRWIAGDLSKPDIANITIYKTAKEAEISAACNKAIVSGVDVETTQGLEHFSLKEVDQINLTMAFNAIQQGVAMYPYHSDGKICRMFTAEEITSISNAFTRHKLYHTTLCNHLLIWVRRAETIKEINAITYSADNLPEDLAVNMENILAAMNSVMKM